MFRKTLTALAVSCCWTTAEAQDGWARNKRAELAYWVRGCVDGLPLVVINGQGVASRPDDGLTAALVAAGFRVILFDSRDAGRSTVFRAAGAPPDSEVILEALAAERAPPVAYGLSDMAADTIAVLDAAGVERVHVLGHSLGGMVAQVVAAEYPERVLSLISISSTSGDPALALGPAMASLSEPAGERSPTVADEQASVYRLFEGKAYPMTDDEVFERVAADMAADDPNAAGRQGAAAVASGDRRALLQRIMLPALVIHGGDDPWFPLDHAASVSAALGLSRLEVIDGLGHIISDAAGTIVAARIAAFVKTLPP